MTAPGCFLLFVNNVAYDSLLLFQTLIPDVGLVRILNRNPMQKLKTKKAWVATPRRKFLPNPYPSIQPG